MSSHKKFQWTQDLETGVTEMDSEHVILIEKINQLVDDLNKGNMQLVRSSFKDLGEYVVLHFKNEEAYMESIGFPALNLHKTIHTQLLDKVGEFADQIEKDNLDSVLLVNFLNMWLRSHIMGIDMKYGEHANKQAS